MGQDLFASMSISASGLHAQRQRMTTIAKNIANAETTRGEDGGPYRRREVAIAGAGLQSPATPPALATEVALHRTSPQHLEALGAPPAAPAPVPTVTAQEVVDENAAFQRVYDPQHPDADADGYVRMPDVNMVAEMVDLAAATRAYEANLAAMKAYQNIFNKSLEI